MRIYIEFLRDDLRVIKQINFYMNITYNAHELLFVRTEFAFNKKRTNWIIIRINILLISE